MSSFLVLGFESKWEPRAFSGGINLKVDYQIIEQSLFVFLKKNKVHKYKYINFQEFNFLGF